PEAIGRVRSSEDAVVALTAVRVRGPPPAPAVDGDVISGAQVGEDGVAPHRNPVVAGAQVQLDLVRVGRPEGFVVPGAGRELEGGEVDLDVHPVVLGGPDDLDGIEVGVDASDRRSGRVWSTAGSA